MSRISLFLILFLVLLCQMSQSQNTSVQIIDAQSSETIPYANIIINSNENLISNSEGFFSVAEKYKNDTTVFTISYLGYNPQTITFEEIEKYKNIIRLQPSMFQLDEVKVSNKKINPLEIMTLVKANVKNNYKANSQPTKSTIFFRETNALIPKVLDVEIKKSTGYSKENLKKTNQQLEAFTSKLIKQPSKEYSDLLCNYYVTKIQKEKITYVSKLDVVKATKLRNDKSYVSLDDIEKSSMNILLTHLDTTKFYRIKSGLFGSRDTISFNKEFNAKKNKFKLSQLVTTKSKLSTLLYENSMSNSTKFSFIHDLELYDYTLEATSYTAENEFIYVINFRPKKRKGKYSGQLFISESDFAVLKVTYSLEEGKKVSGFNMKFLLGVKSSENVSSGTIIFRKNPIEDNYYIHYFSQETGQYIYVNRPLKFIELTNDDREVVAFDLKVETNIRDKVEFLNINRAEFSSDEIEKMKEVDFKFIHLNAYDPKIWEDYISIEPLTEMKQFKSTE